MLGATRGIAPSPPVTAGSTLAPYMRKVAQRPSAALAHTQTGTNGCRNLGLKHSTQALAQRHMAALASKLRTTPSGVPNSDITGTNGCTKLRHNQTNSNSSSHSQVHPTQTQAQTRTTWVLQTQASGQLRLHSQANTRRCAKIRLRPAPTGASNSVIENAVAHPWRPTQNPIRQQRSCHLQPFLSHKSK
jgi:hypothetical protein